MRIFTHTISRFTFTALCLLGLLQSLQAQNRFTKTFQFGNPGTDGIPVMASAVPTDQLMKECSFFGGDSLKGFDFTSKKSQAYAEGNLMFSEFRVFMFREQVKFIKAKYNIAQLPFEMAREARNQQLKAEQIRLRDEAVAHKHGENPSPTGVCNNLDLEAGNYSGWLGGSGVNTNSNGPLTLAGQAYYNTNQNVYDCNDFQLISSAYGNDIVGNFSGKDPNGGNYSSRVGGVHINRAYGYGGCDAPNYHWDMIYSNGEYVENTFAVNASNCLLSYNYAVVLNDGGHPNGQQPYFHVEIVNASGTVLSSCTQYYVQAPAGSSPPGFTLSSTPLVNVSGSSYYLPWTANSINLTPYIGQNVTARFTAAGCTQGGHFGYAYVDASCGPVTITQSPVAPCAGGTAVLTAPAVAGGSYSWSGPGIVGSTNGQSVTVNVGGTYSVTVTPAQGPACAYTLSSSISFTTITAPVSSSTNVNCFGGNTGSATVNPSGGTPNYSYSWLPAGGNAQTANNLTAGNYVVIVTDANGCTKTASVTITQPAAALSNTSSSMPAGCTVANGSASVNVAGGTPGYTYVWSPGGQNAATATGLAGGPYSVIITDSKGCSQSANVNVGITASPSTTASSTQSTCGNANGSGTANPSGGTPGYSFIWNNGQTTQTATGLNAGSYNVTVTDANGCTASAAITVTSANGPTVAASTLNNVSCFGGNNGSASANPTGGTPGYNYVWSNGQTTQTATGLSAGTYTVIVTDQNNCSFITTTSVTQPTLLATTASPVNVSCFGGNGGTATANPTGGTPGYTYAWSDGQTNATAVGLLAGNYIVTVTDANGCTASTLVNVNQPTVLSSALSSTNVLCNGGNTGAASVTAAGGTPSYSYAWSPSGGNSANANNLSAGNYLVVITDANGCTSTQSITITEPALLTATTTQSNVSCNGGNDGTAIVNASGGTSGYNYLWTPGGSIGSWITGLLAGNYLVTVTDANGCTTSVPVVITQPTALALTTSQTNVLCNGGNSGSATVAVAGGNPSYSYSWTPTNAASATANGLSAGNYAVTVTDANGCTSVDSVTITEPPAITLQVSGNDSACRWDNTILTASVNGGSPAYTYLWSPSGGNSNSITVSPSVSTTYSVSITDANGCVSTLQTFNLTVNPGPTAQFDTTLLPGQFSSTFDFTDMSNGATSWLWNFGDGSSTSPEANPQHTFPGAGTYTVTQIVFNQYGCPDTFTVVIILPPGILIPNVFTPNGDGSNDEWYIPNSGMTDFNVEIFDRWGLKLFETSGDEIRWDGRSSSGNLLADGTYYYILTAILKTENGGTDYSTKGHVTLLTRRGK